MKLFIKDLVTFTEEIFSGKLHFLCALCIAIPKKCYENLFDAFISDRLQISLLILSKFMPSN